MSSFLRASLSLLPLAFLLLCAGMLTPSAWADGENNPAASKEVTGKKKKKKKKKENQKKKKAQAATAAEPLPVKALLPQEAAREMERFDDEILCIAHSSLSPEEKLAAVRSLYPKAAPIALAARDAGGMTALLNLQAEQNSARNALFKQLETKHQLSRGELLDRPDLLPEELRAWDQERKQLCAKYKLDSKQHFSNAAVEPLKKEVKAFILACNGIPVEAQKAADNATPQQINTATMEWVQALLDILNSGQSPAKQAESICRNNQNYVRYILALQNDQELYSKTTALLKVNEELRQKRNALGGALQPLLLSNYGGCMPLKSAIGTYWYLWSSNFNGF